MMSSNEGFGYCDTQIQINIRFMKYTIIFGLWQTIIKKQYF